MDKRSILMKLLTISAVVFVTNSLAFASTNQDAPAADASNKALRLLGAAITPSLPLMIEDSGVATPVTNTGTAIKQGTLSATLKDSGQGKVATIGFQQTRSGRLFFDADTPLNLSNYINSGMVSFDLNVHDVAEASVKVEVGCGNDCSNTVDIWPQIKLMQQQGWQHIVMPMHCFDSAQADFSVVSTPLSFNLYGTGSFAIANVQIQSQGKGNIDCPDQDTITVTPAPLATYWAEDWWLLRHQQKLVEKNTLAPQLVLIGDSITHGWEDKGAPVWQAHFGHIPTLNLGFSGDRTENVLWRLAHGELDGVSPKMVMMMIGTNNTGHRMDPPGAIRDGVARIIQDVRLRTPNSKIVLLAIFPRGADNTDKERLNNQATNQLLKQLAKAQDVEFVNINQRFVDDNGHLSKAIMPDLLHPNETGYERWADAISPIIFSVFNAKQY